jgi:hypothetical protein
MNISEGASYTINRQDFECDESIVDGKRLLTCKGPRSTETTAEVTACNDACLNSPDQTGTTTSCDPGYTLDTTSGACVYSPIPVNAGATGCPASYKQVDRGGVKTCALGPGGDGLCPSGLYLDELYGACVSPVGSADLPYGISNPELAQQSFAGCAPGYSYESSFQCCQAADSTAYPVCAPGSKYDADSKSCMPIGVRVSSVGCVTAEAVTIKCSEPKDICSRVTKEPICIGLGYACVWDDKLSVCKPK